MIRNADAAIDEAKDHGRHGIAVFDASMVERARRRVDLEAELRGSLLRDELTLEYQPIVRLPDGQGEGLEALLRWTHPTLGRVKPAEFIPIAEETGLIMEVGAWVIDEACRMLADLRRNVPFAADVHVSVNVYARQVQDGGLVEHIRGALARHGLEGGALRVELTESAFLGDVDATVETLTQLRAIAAPASLDDFGTGYSSLAYLQRYRVDEVKIDEAFISALRDGSSVSAPLVSVMVGIARGSDTRRSPRVPRSGAGRPFRRAASAIASGHASSGPRARSVGSARGVGPHGQTGRRVEMAAGGGTMPNRGAGGSPRLPSAAPVLELKAGRRPGTQCAGGQPRGVDGHDGTGTGPPTNRKPHSAWTTYRAPLSPTRGCGSRYAGSHGPQTPCRTPRRTPHRRQRTSASQRSCAPSRAAGRHRRARAVGEASRQGPCLQGVTIVVSSSWCLVGASRGWRGGHSLASDPGPYTTSLDTTRGYPLEFRRRALDLIDAGRKVAEVARDLDVSEQTLYTWRHQDRIDRGLEPGTTSLENAALTTANKHIQQLETELEIACRAVELLKEPPELKGGSRPSK